MLNGTNNKQFASKKRPYRIGLSLLADKNWMGGVHYIQNIVLALSTLPESTRSQFELCAIAHQRKDLDLFQDYLHHFNQVFVLEAIPPPKKGNLLKKLSKKIAKRKSFHKIFSAIMPSLNQPFLNQFDQFIQKSGIDFLYPHFANEHANPPYHHAAWIPDFQHKHLPQFFTPQEIAGRDESFLSTAMRSPKIVVSSHHAKADFQQFLPQIPIEKIFVLTFSTYPHSKWYEPNPVETIRFYHLPERYLIVCNQFWSHKNHLLVLKALELLQNEKIFPHLVFTGRLHEYRDPNYIDHMLTQIHSLGLASQISLLGLIPRQNQIQLMRGALAVIQPSLFEGWSTVVEDARTLGKPIVLSNIPVHLEQNPLLGIFFQKEDSQALAQAIKTAWLNYQPGPNKEKESKSKNHAIKASQSLGMRFLELAGCNVKVTT